LHLVHYSLGYGRRLKKPLRLASVVPVGLHDHRARIGIPAVDKIGADAALGNIAHKPIDHNRIAGGKGKVFTGNDRQVYMDDEDIGRLEVSCSLEYDDLATGRPPDIGYAIQQIIVREIIMGIS